MSSILTLTFSKENTMWQQTRSFFFLISQKQSVSRSKLFVFLLSKNIEGRTRPQVTEKELISLLFSFLSFLGKKLFLSLLQLPVATKKVLSFFAWKQQKKPSVFLAKASMYQNNIEIRVVDALFCFELSKTKKRFFLHLQSFLEQTLILQKFARKEVKQCCSDGMSLVSVAEFFFCEA